MTIFLIPWVHDAFPYFPQSLNDFFLIDTKELDIQVEMGPNSFQIISSFEGQFNPNDK